MTHSASLARSFKHWSLETIILYDQMTEVDVNLRYTCFCSMNVDLQQHVDSSAQLPHVLVIRHMHFVARKKHTNTRVQHSTVIGPQLAKLGPHQSVSVSVSEEANWTAAGLELEICLDIQRFLVHICPEWLPCACFGGAFCHRIFFPIKLALQVASCNSCTFTGLVRNRLQPLFRHKLEGSDITCLQAIGVTSSPRLCTPLTYQPWSAHIHTRANTSTSFLI